MSPASSITISPGTISLEGISCFTPFLITLALGADNCLRLSNERCALICCTVPRTAFIISTSNITMVLSTLPENIEIIAAIIKITTSKSQNWPKNTSRVLFFFPTCRIFSPVCPRVSSTRALFKPCSVTSNFCKSSCVE